MPNLMLQLDNFPSTYPIIRNTLQMAEPGLMNIINDTGAVMAMITDHGTGYMTNKKVTSHQVTGCLNVRPKGGLHIADFNFLLRMDDPSERFNGMVLHRRITNPGRTSGLRCTRFTTWPILAQRTPIYIRCFCAIHRLYQRVKIYDGYYWWSQNTTDTAR